MQMLFSLFHDAEPDQASYPKEKVENETVITRGIPVMSSMRILFCEQGLGRRDAQGLRPSCADSSQCGDAPAFYLRVSILPALPQTQG
jgi:hypothetical protein